MSNFFLSFLIYFRLQCNIDGSPVHRPTGQSFPWSGG
jgi:hypothetical protein